MEFKTGYSEFKADEFLTNSGNGKNVPQFYLDEKNKVIKPKLDKDGKQVMHSLYDDIQKNKNANDYKKALMLNPSLMDSDNVDWKDMDVSEMGDFETINNAFNKVKNATGKDVFELLKEYESKLNSVSKEKEKETVQETKQEIVKEEK